jgi:hypothetical protein
MTPALQAAARNLRGARGRAWNRRAASVFSPAQRPDGVVLRPADSLVGTDRMPGVSTVPCHAHLAVH